MHDIYESFIVEVSEDESVVTSATGDSNFSLGSTSINGGLYSGVDGGVYESSARFYLKFHLPEYVANTQVISATLTGFYYDDFEEQDDSVHGIYFVASDSWSEATITFNNQPGQAYGTSEATFTAAEATPGNFFSWDLTDIVNQEYQEDGTLSLLVHADRESVTPDNRNFEYFVEKEFDRSKAFRLEMVTALSSPDKALRYEAEQLELRGYQVESVLNSGASNSHHISLKNTGIRTGSAQGIFDGMTGIYQVVVGYYDENDGTSLATITVAEESTRFRFDRDLPTNSAQFPGKTTRLTHPSIELRSGDRFEISAQAKDGEFARFDYIDFIPVNEAVPTDNFQTSAIASI